MSLLFLLFQLRESTAVSIENLEKCIQCGRVLKLPVSKCFPVLSDNTEDFSLIWDNCVTVTPQEYHCQVKYIYLENRYSTDGIFQRIVCLQCSYPSMSVLEQ